MSSPITTTLVAAIGVNENSIEVASAEGITNPGEATAYNQTATYIQIDEEWMQVNIEYELGSVYVPVIRGTDGSAVLPHAAGASVLITHETPNSPWAIPND